MKNIDKIRQMSAEELAGFFEKMWSEGKCILCAYNDGKCSQKDCTTGQVAWLNQAINPMPELETGDLVQTFIAIYVAVGNGKIVDPITMRKIPLGNVLASVSFIYRHDGKKYQEIWRKEKYWLEEAIEEGKAAYCRKEGDQ